MAVPLMRKFRPQRTNWKARTPDSKELNQAACFAFPALLETDNFHWALGTPSGLGYRCTKTPTWSITALPRSVTQQLYHATQELSLQRWRVKIATPLVCMAESRDNITTRVRPCVSQCVLAGDEQALRDQAAACCSSPEAFKQCAVRFSRTFRRGQDLSRSFRHESCVFASFPVFVPQCSLLGIGTSLVCYCA